MAAKDYCTLFPEGIPGTKYKWGDCCKDHDENFEEGEISFSDANLYLWHCVRRKGQEYAPVAYILWLGTSMFGFPFWIYQRARDRQ